MKQMIKQLLVACSIAFAAAACTQQPKQVAPAAKAGMTYATTLPFKTNGGWGYEIYLDGKRYIRQPFIPAVAGNVPFATKEDAQKVAALIVKKMSVKSSSLPAVSIQELQALHIAAIP